MHRGPGDVETHGRASLHPLEGPPAGAFPCEHHGLRALACAMILLLTHITIVLYAHTYHD